jgi:flavorubredoxin
MYQSLNITEDIFYVGVNDRHSSLFENQLPLPHGVSYNAYLINDAKVALIDTVEVGFAELFLKKIETALGNRSIDYLVVNHMEPDHAGAIRLIRERYPALQIVGNAKTADMLQGYFGIADNVIAVKDGDVLELGKHRLRFTLAPMVHWPETMLTYDTTDKVLFSGDAFGTFGALNGGVVDCSLNTDIFWDEMRRYYACIVGKYAAPVQSALAKLKGVELRYICSTHGPVWHEHIARAMGSYARWSQYEAAPGVAIAYGTMYGNTGQMAEAVAKGLVAGGVKDVVMHDVAHTDASFILSDIFKYRGFVAGSATYMNELLPGVESLLRKVESRGVKDRVFAAFGSFSWAGVAIKKLVPFAEKLNWSIVGTVEEKQALKAEKYKECVALGKSVAQKLSEAEPCKL